MVMLFRRFLSNSAGNFSTMLALASVPLLLASGAAIDFSRANHARTVLQAAADAAALGGGSSKDKSDAQLQSLVEQYLDVNNAKAVLEHVSKIEQALDPEKGTFEVKISGKMKTSFMVIGGITEMDIGVSSQVNVGSEALEVAMVLDNTGSMSGVKIANLKSAATNLVDILEKETSSNADVKIGLVPFAEYVNVGASNINADWIDKTALAGGTFDGCVGSRTSPLDLTQGAIGGDYPALSGEPCNAELLPLTDDFNQVRTRISTMNATGNTYVPGGILWGWNVLSSDAPFTQGRTASELKAARGKKAMIVMTDGENTISPSYPKHDNFVPAQSNDNMTALCDAVKKENIEIYTVSFMVSSPTIENLLINCATTPAKYFNADNGAQLNQAFVEIAQELAALRLTQ
jgi:Flp pilus assembly protein TadG